MFDFAISHNQKHRPTKRLYVSAAISCILHVLLFIVLVENPWLLQGGLYSHFRGLIIVPDDSIIDLDDEDYRTVAVLKPMEMPPAETLKDLIYDWDESGETETDDSVSVGVRWGSDDENAPDEDISISAEIPSEPETTPAGEDEASSLTQRNMEDSPETGSGLDAFTAQAIGIAPKQAPQKESAPQEVESVDEEEQIALNTEPLKIPDSIPQLENAGNPDTIKTFENEEQAIAGQGIGIFDHQDFPLDEYASHIKQLVTRNWYIPSNLRDSNAYTTIIFYIDRNGQNFDTHIVNSSGNNSLDLTALNAIINSNPFPPLPNNFPGEHIGVKYVFMPEIR